MATTPQITSTPQRLNWKSITV